MGHHGLVVGAFLGDAHAFDSDAFVGDQHAFLRHALDVRLVHVDFADAVGHVLAGRLRSADLDVQQWEQVLHEQQFDVLLEAAQGIDVVAHRP